MSEKLNGNEFAAFFEAVHAQPQQPGEVNPERVRPFPWQERLARTVFQEGWPQALDLPTGTGKTAAIDIAIFHLALQADLGVARTAPVRILFVVDRRLIVDDAFARAKKIAGRLRDALASNDSGILGRVASRLAHLAEQDGPPLAVVRLRGGTPKEPDWVRTPTQPTVVVSTIDQVGSRMLFRGYGVSDTMKPLHAGLLGADALFLLDEAHLSQPFVQTARDARMFQESGPWSEDKAPAPFKIVTLSATQDVDIPFGIDAEDWNDERLGRRLNAPKPAELIPVDAKAANEDFAKAFAERAWTLSKAPGGEAIVVAVVVNRVKRARRIFAALVKMGALPINPEGSDEVSAQTEISDGPPGAALLIGRARDLDRDRLGLVRK